MKSNTYYMFFQNLANKLKINIISTLLEKELTVSEICNKLKVEQSKVSHALKNLLQCKIVEVKQKGKNRIYSLNKKTITPMLKLVEEHENKFCHGCCKRCEK